MIDDFITLAQVLGDCCACSLAKSSPSTKHEKIAKNVQNFATIMGLDCAYLMPPAAVLGVWRAFYSKFMTSFYDKFSKQAF
ncbi:hypothetical protein B0181_00495 [Moraxella caviae]|uniref:Uncharacterized protein n=1 Tax=Moraxella caviae TaxID=34060 RepID=A0A1T0ABW3_9GAMM|nr:hypothetical protein B0181_00495 [Moraxella caviae]